MKRLYDTLLKKYLNSDFDEMLLVSGPRQAGKTTVSKACGEDRSFTYLNWDNEDDKKLILQGPKAIADVANLHKLTEQKPIIAFDEIHKHSDWKNFLKGFYDTYQGKVRIVVTGSARLDVYKKGGDSLMGRYLHFRMHPLSVAECVRTTLAETEISPPKKITDKEFNALFEFGGYPKPFTKHDKQFSRQWQRLRHQQLIHSFDDGSGSVKYAVCNTECNCSLDELHAHFYCNYCKIYRKNGFLFS